MPLQRIRADVLGLTPEQETQLQAEALNLTAGRTMLNRRAEAATALIVAQGSARVGVADDDATLGQGQGVLLAADEVYSLQALEESVVLLFALPDG
jgi:quercetin dioxygenase-like cupin family protein